MFLKWGFCSAGLILTGNSFIILESEFPLPVTLGWGMIFPPCIIL